ncbi:MAG: reverse transcriptase-like protein [Nitrospira sp.]
MIGDGTGNIAEYRAAIGGLRRAYDMGAKEIELRMDSELVIRQIEGRYQDRKDT